MQSAAASHASTQRLWSTLGRPAIDSAKHGAMAACGYDRGRVMCPIGAYGDRGASPCRIEIPESEASDQWGLCTASNNASNTW